MGILIPTGPNNPVHVILRKIIRQLYPVGFLQEGKTSKANTVPMAIKIKRLRAQQLLRHGNIPEDVVMRPVRSAWHTAFRIPQLEKWTLSCLGYDSGKEKVPTWKL